MMWHLARYDASPRSQRVCSSRDGESRDCTISLRIGMSRHVAPYQVKSICLTGSSIVQPRDCLEPSQTRPAIHQLCSSYYQPHTR